MGCKAEAASRGRSGAKPCGRQWATLFRHRFPQSGRSPAGLKPPAGQQRRPPSAGSRAISSRSSGTDVTTPVCSLDRVSRGVINLCALLSITPPSTMRLPRDHREAPTVTERRRNNARTPHRQDRQRAAVETIESRALRCARWRGTTCISQRVMCTITIIRSARVCFRKTTVQRSVASHLRRRIARISRQIAVLRDVFDYAHREHRAFDLARAHAAHCTPFLMELESPTVPRSQKL